MGGEGERNVVYYIFWFVPSFLQLLKSSKFHILTQLESSAPSFDLASEFSTEILKMWRKIFLKKKKKGNVKWNNKLRHIFPCYPPASPKSQTVENQYERLTILKLYTTTSSYLANDKQCILVYVILHTTRFADIMQTERRASKSMKLANYR